MRTAAQISDDTSRLYGFNGNFAHFQGNGLINNTKYFQATTFKDLCITHNDHADDAGIVTLHLSINHMLANSPKNFHRMPSMKSKPTHVTIAAIAHFFAQH
jgi:hypothetical protein